jgi:hypothetical protein
MQRMFNVTSIEQGEAPDNEVDAPPVNLGY